jgi:hypothetical protein
VKDRIKCLREAVGIKKISVELVKSFATKKMRENIRK